MVEGVGDGAEEDARGIGVGFIFLSHIILPLHGVLAF